jgi:hypothetical protein
MRNNKWLSLAALALFGGWACKAFQASPTSSPALIQTAIAQTQTAQPTATLALLYADDFSDSASGWLTGQDPTDPEAVFAYSEGEYHIRRLKGHDLVARTMAHQNFKDGFLSVDARRVSGALWDTNTVILWRISPDSNYYYTLYINGESQFSVFKFNGNDLVVVHDWEANLAILGDQAVNHIDIVFIGDLSLIYINDERVAVFNDSASLQGDIGLGAGGSTTSEVEIAFDNLMVHATE